MTIKSISIENFQSHVATSIDFCEGLNVIAGASDSGKSSILRAMAWVIRNRPSGDAIRNWDCRKSDPVIVEMVLENDGKEITLSKERTGSSTKYSSSEFGDLAVVGRDVPEEVSRLLNLSDSNFQTQHDAYFLLNDSPGAVAKTLNDLVGLSVIDTIFKNINSWSLTVKRQSEESQTSINKLQDEINRYQYLDQLEKDLIKAEKLSKSLSEKRDRFDRLNELSLTIDSTKKFLEKAKEILPAEKELIVIREKRLKLAALCSTRDHLVNLAKSIRESQSKLKEETDWLAVEGPFLALKSLALRQKKIIEKRGALLKITENYEYNKKTMRTAIGKIKEATVKFKDTIRANKVCPTCFREFDEETIERMAGG